MAMITRHDSPLQDDLLIWIERLFWVLALAASIGFIVVKLAAWRAGDVAGGGDDFQAYYCASHVLRQDPSALYAPIVVPSLEAQRVTCTPYLYAPTIALLFSPLANFSFVDARRIWFAGNLAIVAGIVAILWRMAGDRRVRRYALAMFLLSPALWDAIYLGQISPLLGLWVVGAVWLSARSGSLPNFTAGLLIALAGAIKPFIFILILLVPWHRRWSMALGIITGMACMILPGLLLLPIAASQHYVEVLSSVNETLAMPGGTNFWNQSAMAFWERAFQSGDTVVNLQGQPHRFLLLSSLPDWLLNPVKIATVAMILLATVWALYRRRSWHTQVTGSVWGAGLLLLCALIVAPLTWNHYLVIGAPVFVAVAEHVKAPPSGWRILIPAGFFLTVAQRGAVLWLQILPNPMLISLFFFGMLVWWMVLLQGGLAISRRLSDGAIPNALHDQVVPNDAT